jgi:hypothetical protein
MMNPLMIKKIDAHPADRRGETLERGICGIMQCGCQQGVIDNDQTGCNAAQNLQIVEPFHTCPRCARLGLTHDGPVALW